jgi:glutamyl-tRNA synthetase
VPEEHLVPSVIGDGSAPAATGADVRCRFAPSPTGELHVGNARTALFSWLTARHHGGAFVLRVEDTDRERSTDAAIGILIRSLRWLGIDWDEGPEVGGPNEPYRQTQGLAYFAQVTRRFLAEDRAYRCYCTPAELEDRRRAALARGETPGYDGRCRHLSPEQRAVYQAENRPFAVRFAMPGVDITVHDLIRGETTFPASDLKDFVIMRSNGIPTYLLAAAADDVRMGITHVIRGEDLMPSTPRQVEIMRAMGASPPAFAHLPLIVGPGGQKLSKRFHAQSVERFREDGFLPEALVNYLALLGWSKDASTTFLSLHELVRDFDVSHVSRNPAVFDLQKLEWLNGHYIRHADDDRLTDLLLAEATTAGLAADHSTIASAVPLIKERMHTVAEGLGLIRFLFVDDAEPDEKAERMLGSDRAEVLSAALGRLEDLPEWTADAIHGALQGLRDELGLSSKNAFQPVRAAVTGTLVSPPLFESLELLGRERSLARLRTAAARAVANGAS